MNADGLHTARLLKSQVEFGRAGVFRFLEKRYPTRRAWLEVVLQNELSEGSFLNGRSGGGQWISRSWEYLTTEFPGTSHFCHNMGLCIVQKEIDLK